MWQTNKASQDLTSNGLHKYVVDVLRFLTRYRALAKWHQQRGILQWALKPRFHVPWSYIWACFVVPMKVVWPPLGNIKGILRHDGCELHRYLRSSQTWTFRCSGRGTIAGFTTPTWMRTWSEPAKVWRSGCTGSSLSSACWAGSSLGCEPTGRKGW